MRFAVQKNTKNGLWSIVDLHTKKIVWDNCLTRGEAEFKATQLEAMAIRKIKTNTEKVRK